MRIILKNIFEVSPPVNKAGKFIDLKETERGQDSVPRFQSQGRRFFPDSHPLHPDRAKYFLC